MGPAIKRNLLVVARILLGVIFFVLGVNGLVPFIPPPEMGESASSFMLAITKTGYFMPFLKAVEVTCGLALIINWFVPLALLILAPIVIQIVLFHLFLEPGGIFLGLFAAILLDYLMWNYRSYYRVVISRTAKPD